MKKTINDLLSSQIIDNQRWYHQYESPPLVAIAAKARSGLPSLVVPPKVLHRRCTELKRIKIVETGFTPLTLCAKQRESLKKNRSEKFYKQIVCFDYILKEDVKNIMQIPKITKIILNTTSKSCVIDKKYLIPPLVALQLLSGQKLKYTKSKTSIATYKLRKNQLIGCKVNLHGEKMYNFLEKFINIILPRFREFSGIVDINLDKNGNLTLGIKNLLVFPELENSFEFFDFIQGMNITFVTSINDKEKSKLLFSRLQFPTSYVS